MKEKKEIRKTINELTTTINNTILLKDFTLAERALITSELVRILSKDIANFNFELCAEKEWK